MTTGTFYEHLLSPALKAAQLSFEANQARPVRLGENAIFQFADTIVRISRPGQVKAAQREVDVARWLASAGVPAVRPLSVEQPILVEDRAVTFWELLPEHTPGTVTDVARLLRRLHSLPLPEHLELGTLDPFVRLRDRIADASGFFSTEDLNWLSCRLDHLEQAWDRLPEGQPQSVVHGDAWTGNVARCTDGTAVLLDLERCSVGPPEWDLVSTAMKTSTVTWLDQADYTRFVESYGGYDVVRWPGFTVMRDIRELRMTLYFAQHAARPSMRDQAQLRIDCLRGRRGNRPWPWTPDT
ncbi:phosphotransferase enzyme family protein [Nocardiopsis sp. FR4]|uniref:phosphotransferase enzyme family protein n=1 Tax=Nocardiopsis sp. FR4 TaxID=2605985 RepID=UPI00135B1541|nr:aminoglycoside phosphotransferase family protein [Nocardiopsis sp. FR4]